MREQTKKMLAVGFILLWVSVFIPNVPMEWGKQYVTVARKLLFPVHALLGLGGTYGMGMFARPQRRGNMCMIALGFHDDGGGSELLFRPPIKDCVNPGVRLRQNHGHHAFFKYYEMLVRPGSAYRVYREWKRPEDSQMGLGEMFCRWSGSGRRAVDQIFVGMFRERYYPDYQLMQRGAPVQKLRTLIPGFGYSCSRHTLVSIAGPAVFAALARDHPAIYEIFRDYQAEAFAE